MDRRTTLKGFFLLASVGISSFSLYKWFSEIEMPDLTLLDKKTRYIAELAELIIPRTETPGAKDANVEIFIINYIKFCADAVTQSVFINGVKEVEDYARDRYGKDFLRCSDSEKVEVLSYFEKNSIYKYTILNKVRNRILGPPFFSQLKSLTIEGYCNSMLGATQGLAYDEIPGSFISCMPLEKSQRSWATK